MLPTIKSSRPSHVSADYNIMPLYSKPDVYSARPKVESQAILAQKLINETNLNNLSALRNIDRANLAPVSRKLSPSPGGEGYKRPLSIQSHL